MKDAYSIYDTKAHLSKILKRVKNGQEITITERGTPIVRLVPFLAIASFQKRVDTLVEQGVILPARKDQIPDTLDTSKKTGALKRFLEDR
jgi:prevent-host-death family protein